MERRCNVVVEKYQGKSVAANTLHNTAKSTPCDHASVQCRPVLRSHSLVPLQTEHRQAA